MPSMVLGRPYASGATQIISGNFWSGQSFHPQAGIQLVWQSSGGNCYIALSGGGPPLSGNHMTINSGGMTLSGGAFISGALDGTPIIPGGGLWIPAYAFKLPAGVSGNCNIFAMCDAQASGIGRLSWEVW